ncbi:hypothetical protein CHGG_09820 [Chaetomium globosum CBS 148.51]|uniref:Uncharacterized protein n=1 Tax=Chaetomium globosum (strain ATCC 6205 / CBS 148.51 / DSM 1962 / NBRC 6347 / NRRL 1970) TaxID=306901 RepID=Q2GQD4_CHAGB|nr:uncharacterized protein CHGG_09820 [Chaetomium globosum CBS 148.51]EAQ83416.1 hypothetical protein CHGG_09820 [Chaetomium globosum CBS 148.51]
MNGPPGIAALNSSGLSIFPVMKGKAGRLMEAFVENLARLRQSSVTVGPGSPSFDVRNDKRPGDGPLSPNRNSQFGPHSRKAASTNGPYFRLPDTARFKVMKYLLAGNEPHDKPIRMNHPVFLWEVWPVSRPHQPGVGSTGYFDSLQSVLSSVDNYTSVCSAMRADVLATLFLTRRFHVVYSPHVRKETQLAATHYMDRYGPLMASITLEVDFTKLAGGWRPEAVYFDALRGLKGVKTLIEDFVQRQLTRRNTSIQDLRVLVRRYHGFRPTASAPSPDPPKPDQNDSQHHHPTGTPSPPPTLSPISTNQSPPQPRPSPPPSTPPTPPTPTPKPTPYTDPAHIAHTLSPLKSLGPLVSTLHPDRRPPRLCHRAPFRLVRPAGACIGDNRRQLN